jgi:hypothetical protein
MDSHQFDDLARWLSAPGSRRLVLAALLGGALSALPPANSTAKKGKGKGKKRKRKKRGGSPPPSPPVCQGVPNDSPCSGPGRCLDGLCNQPPTCQLPSDNVGCNTACCNTGCTGGFPCGQIVAGGPCKGPSDCVPGQGLVCIGFRCVAT